MADYKDYGYTNNEPLHTFFYLREPLLAMLDKRVNKAILDVGCGNGHFVNYLTGKGYNAYGTDASENGIAIARRDFDPARFFIQDLSRDKLPPELQQIPFDTIISTEVIEHLYDPEGFVIFCKQSLVQNGELILSTPYHGYLKNLALAVFNKWDSHLSPGWCCGHIKFWSRRTLTKLLTDNGFRVTRFKGCGRVPYLWKSMIIKAKLS